MKKILPMLFLLACSSTPPQTRAWILDSKLGVLRGFKEDESEDVSMNKCLLPSDPELKNGGMVCYVIDQASKMTFEKYIVHLESELNSCQAQKQ